MDIGAFIDGFRATRGLTVEKLAGQLGYKSKTSVIRILQGRANRESVDRFVGLLLARFELTDSEVEALKMAAKITALGEHGYTAEREMFTFLRGENHPVYPDAEAEIEEIHTGIRQSLPQKYADASDIEIVLLNCPYVQIYPQLKTLLREKQARVQHYIMVDGNAARTIHAVNAALAIFFEKGYEGHVRMMDDAADSIPINKGVADSDMLICSYCDAQGQRREDLIVFNSMTHGYADTARNFGEYARMFAVPRERYEPFKRFYFEYSAFENYIQYSQDYAGLEFNRAIYKIKPDIGIDYIAVDILEAALWDGPIPKDESFADTANELSKIYAERYQNAFTKRAPAYTVLKREAMREFALTGKTSDHFWGMRPFTVPERIRILSNLLEQQRQNPYFNLYFLRDGATLRDVEISCYDGIGILILDANTDYNLAEGHVEAMITHREFSRIYKAFMVQELIPRHSMAAKESCRVLEELIQLCRSL